MSDSEDEDQSLSIGLNKAQREEHKATDKIKEKKKNYKKEILKIEGSLPVIYMGCSFFKNLNKIFFLLMLLFLLQ